MSHEIVARLFGNPRVVKLSQGWPGGCGGVRNSRDARAYDAEDDLRPVGSGATPECPAQVEEWMADERPTAVCGWHRQTPRGIVVDWPPAYRAWAATERRLSVVAVSAHPTAARTPSEVARAENPPSSRAELRIVNPPDGAIYLVDPTLRHELQTIGFRGTTEAKARIDRHIDGERLGSTDPDASLDWPLTPGRHLSSALDTRGRRASAEIVVK